MEIVDKVRHIIADTLNVPVEQLKPETRLDDIGAESLDVIEIVFELEEKFGINIPFKADEGPAPSRGGGSGGPTGDLPFRTIRDVAAAVQGLIDAKPRS